MNTWLVVALVAYTLGALIEGSSAAHQLLHSVSSSTAESSGDENCPGQRSWRVLVAITTVSLCGAIFWPCRLLHRTLKSEE
jgi:hypothetical protein